MSKSTRTILMSGAFLFLGGVALAQAPPGPIAPARPEGPSTSAPVAAKSLPVGPRKNIMGTWKLNRDESDNPHAKSKEGTNNTGDPGGHGGYGGPRMGGGWPGGGMGGPGMGGPGMGGHGGQGGPQGRSSENHNKALDATRPPEEMTLTQRLEKDPEIDLADDRDHRQAFFTDGRKLAKTQDSSYEQIAARWDGNKLVTDEKGPHGGKMTRTFELSPDGRQLWETIQITSGKHEEKSTTIRYVFDATAPEPGKEAAS